jgi:hypothetical protein
VPISGALTCCSQQTVNHHEAPNICGQVKAPFNFILFVKKTLIENKDVPLSDIKEKPGGKSEFGHPSH